LIHSKEVHNNTKMTVLVVKYFTYLKHAAALDRLRVRLNVILLKLNHFVHRTRKEAVSKVVPEPHGPLGGTDIRYAIASIAISISTCRFYANIRSRHSHISQKCAYRIFSRTNCHFLHFHMPVLCEHANGA